MRLIALLVGWGLLLVSICSGSHTTAAQTETNHPAPPLSIETLLQAPAGASVAWEELEGKIVVVEFWATWCGPCVAAIPHLNEVAEAVKDDAVVILAVTDQPADVIQRFLAHRPMAAWVGIDTSRKTHEAYGVRGIPRTFVIGRDGQIVADTTPTQVTVDRLRAVLRGEMDVFPTPVAVEPPARRAQSDPEPLVRAEIAPSRYESGSHGRGTWIASGRASKPEWLLSSIFGGGGARLVVEAELPDGLFDYQVRVPKDLPDAPQRLQALANEMISMAWGVRAEPEIRELEVYVLRKGAETMNRLVAVETGGSAVANEEGRHVRFVAMNALPRMMAREIERHIDRPLIDETGIGWHNPDELAEDEWGHGYDFSLMFEKGDIDSLREAMKRSLDIELVAARRKVEFIVIRAVEAPE